MRATFVKSVPPPKRHSRKDQESARKAWEDAANRAVSAPGKAVFLGSDIRRSRIVSARQIVAQFNAALPAGRVLVCQRNQYRGADGELYADLYFEFTEDED